MTDELRAYAGPGPFEHDHEGFKAPTWQELRDLADHNFRLYADAFDRAERAEQECRDRECTEQDVRARLADAENALTAAKVEALREAAAELRANVAAWRARGVAASTPTADWLDARAAALDGTS